MTDKINVGDTVRWRKGGRRTAVVTHVGAGETVVRLDRLLHGATLHDIDDLAVVKPANIVSSICKDDPSQ